MSNGIKRDFNSMKSRKLHIGTKRPLWGGPVPNRYYYIVKNKKHPKMAAQIVRFTDLPNYEGSIRLVANIQGGHRSLIESDLPLPIQPNEGKLLAHSKVDVIKQILWESMDRKSPILGLSGEERLPIKGRPVTDEEIFI